MSKIFFISGLGANELAFSNIGELGCEKVMVKWIQNQKNETIRSYVERLIDLYGISKNDFIAGLSFGGIMAQEIAEILGKHSVILISSFRDKSDLKFPFKQALKTGLYKMFPLVKIPVLEGVVANILNSGSTESKRVLKEMIQSTDYELMNWSVKKIAELQYQKSSGLSLFNIIGTKDRIVSQWSSPHTYIIEGGSHFMVYDRSHEVTEILKTILQEPSSRG